MNRPADHWHREILGPGILSNLDSAMESYEESLVRLAELFESESPGATPEFLARQIGYWLVEKERTPDFDTPVYDDTDGDEGEKLALGYIGVNAFKLAAANEDIK